MLLNYTPFQKEQKRKNSNRLEGLVSANSEFIEPKFWTGKVTTSKLLPTIVSEKLIHFGAIWL